MGKFIEPIIDQIQTLLTNNLDNELNIINLKYNDNITLDSIKKIYKGRMFVLTEFPNIVIWPQFSPGGESTSLTFFNDHTIIVWVNVVNKYSEINEKLNKRLWRYLWATTEVLKADNQLGGIVDVCKIAGHTYESPWVHDSGYMDTGGTILEIRHEEVL